MVEANDVGFSFRLAPGEAVRRHSRSPSTSSVTGNVTSNTLPLPLYDWKRNSPFSARDSSLTIASPRPVPGMSSEAARSNSSNTRS